MPKGIPGKFLDSAAILRQLTRKLNIIVKVLETGVAHISIRRIETSCNVMYGKSSRIIISLTYALIVLFAANPVWGIEVGGQVESTEKLTIKGCGSDKSFNQAQSIFFYSDNTWSLSRPDVTYTGTYTDASLVNGSKKLGKKFKLSFDSNSLSDYIAHLDSGSDNLCQGAHGSHSLQDLEVKRFTAAFNKKGTKLRIKLKIKGYSSDGERLYKTSYSFNAKINAATEVTPPEAVIEESADDVAVSGNVQDSTTASFQCYGCDDTNIKEKDTINKYDNAEGLLKALSLWRIPWLEYDYIPQGIHVTEDGFVYMSLYFKDKDGVTSKSSIVIKYSTVTNIITDIYHLKNSDDSKYKGHLGGLAVSGNYLIVPHGNKLNHFKLSDATPIYGIESEIKLAFNTAVDFGGSEYNYKMSFLSTTKDHLNQDILWTGQFSTSTSMASHVLGYKIESDGTVNPAPIYRFYVPETVNKLQGVTVLNASYDTYTLLLTRSYGNNTSYIYKLNYNRQESSPYKYNYDSTSIAFKGPAGLEDLHASADGIWSLSESGANYYQNRDSNPWDQLFPFFLKLRKSDMY